MSIVRKVVKENKNRQIGTYCTKCQINSTKQFPWKNKNCPFCNKICTSNKKLYKAITDQNALTLEKNKLLANVDD